MESSYSSPGTPATRTIRQTDAPSKQLLLVLAETFWGRLDKVTFELLGEARKIAPGLNCRVEIAMLTSPGQISAQVRDVGYWAQERVHIIEHPQLEDYSTESYLQCLQALFEKLSPRFVLIGATARGRDFGPRLAARLGLAYTPNCLTIKGVGGKLEITRVTHGGQVHVQSCWTNEDAMIFTMKPGVADAPQPLKSTVTLDIVKHEMEVHPGRVRVVERLPAKPETQDIREAEHIVSGGRGVGGPEGFAAIRDLAGALRAAVGASRVAVDSGWIEHARQVGQTGKTVAPRLYVAVGISGVSHHLMGMRGSEKIVAINTDKKAPIFSVSHLGVVGDLHQVLPRLSQRVRRQKSEASADREPKTLKT